MSQDGGFKPWFFNKRFTFFPLYTVSGWVKVQMGADHLEEVHWPYFRFHSRHHLLKWHDCVFAGCWTTHWDFLYFLFPLPASFTDGRLSLSVVQQCHLAGRKFLGPLRFILFHLFYGRGWGKHNSVGTVMALSSPHQEPGNREEEREC